MAEMISVDEAFARIGRTLPVLASEHVPLAAAAGRVLAADVAARMTQPPFTASAMDGYAVRIADARAAGARLTLVGESAAGARFAGKVGVGEAVRIFTGAAVPEGADHVLIQEEAQRDGAAVTVIEPQERAGNVRAAGLDFKTGERLAKRGEALTGPLLALIAAGNVDAVAVVRRPRVAVIANGDELAPPGTALSDNQIVSSIPYGLAPMIAAWGGEPRFIGIARDDRDDIDALIEAALDSDLIVPVGGASVGDRDFMRESFRARGATPVFEKISLKPGKPTWFATIAGGPFVLGLPGNPASALVTGRLFLRAAIGAMLGADVGAEEFEARLGAPLPANGPRETFLRARLRPGEGASLAVLPFENQDSSLLSVMARSDALIRRKGNAAAAAAGDIVRCIRV